MSPRERLAVGTTVAAPQHEGATRAVSGHSEGAWNHPWVDWFTALPTDTQVSLTDLAHRQGFLFTDQVPSAPRVPPQQKTTDISNILAGDATLRGFPFVEPLPTLDSELDPIQRDAVSLALNTPDCFLIQGLPGTGKTRTTIEFIRQSLQRGEKVLFLAPHASRVDAVLMVLEDFHPQMLRILDPEEQLTKLPESIASLTLNLREERFQQQLRTGANEAVQHYRVVQSSLQKAIAILERYPDQIAQLTDLERAIAELSTAIHAIPEQVRTEIETLDVSIAEQQESANRPQFLNDYFGVVNSDGERLAQLEAERIDLQKERLAYEETNRTALAECEALRQNLELQKSGSWWSPSCWKAKRDKSLPDRLSSAEGHCKNLADTLANLQEREKELELRSHRLEAERAERLATLISTEAARRIADTEHRLAALIEGRTTLLTQLESFRQTLQQTGLVVPESLSPEQSQLLRQQAIERVPSIDSECKRAVHWQALVESEAVQIARRCRGSYRLVAGPITAVQRDPWFRDLASQTPFDKVVVIDAHELHEKDFARIAGMGKQWLFVGEPALPVLDISSRFRSAAPRPTTPQVPKPDFFQRLWLRLHQPIWVSEGDRLCCRLASVEPNQRSRLDRENVADQPDIELRIFTPEQGAPALAEIVFPERMSLADAKAFLWREVGEFAIESWCKSVIWQVSAEQMVARFEACDDYDLLPLDSGITEWIGQNATVGIAFDSTWSLDRAKTWLESQLSARRASRTAVLNRAYRAVPPLAAWLNEAIFRMPGYAVSAETSSADAIRFEAVPRHPEVVPGRNGRHRESRNGHAGERSSQRGGAGYEIDLADPRAVASLPAELAGLLPREGYVNYSEAQALIELLFERTAEESVVVTAPYPTQVTLLRQLASRHPRIKAAFLTTESLLQRECDWLFVSLTRSHVSRAVTYGPDPQVLLEAMTRARKGIVFVGDPGTLARRAQWEGGVDHLDEMSGERERAWVKALLRHIPARVLNPSPARIPEGVQV